MSDFNTKDYDKLKDAVKESIEETQDFYDKWADLAVKCVGFLNGEQENNGSSSRLWVNHNPSSGSMGQGNVNDNLKGLRANEIDPIVKTLVSYFTRQKPSVSVFDMTGSSTKTRVARITEKWFQAKYDLDREREIARQAAYWGNAIGTVYIKDFWDATKGDYDPETGDYSGSNNTAVLTPFTVRKDPSVSDFEEIPWIREEYIKDLSWLKANYEFEKGNGYTGLCHLVQADDSANGTLVKFEELKFQVTNRGKNRGKRKNQVTVAEIYVAPSREHKTGRMLVFGNDTCVFDSALRPDGNPYFAPYEPVMWHPYTEYVCLPFLGRSLGKGVIEGLIPLQMRMNEIVRSIVENANTMAKPYIIGTKQQLKYGVVNGRGSRIVHYEPQPNANPPQIVGGTPLPAQFFNEIQQIRDFMVSEVGTNFIMQGKAPTGVTAAAAIDMILENSNNMQSDPLYAFESALQDHFNKKLRVFKKFNSKPSKSLIAKMKMLTGGELDMNIHEFIGQRDLVDGVNIQIEPGSIVPKMNTAKGQQYFEAIKSGVYGPLMGDPTPKGTKFRNELLKKIGLEPIESDENVNFEKAEWENDRIAKGMPVEIHPDELHEIHLASHYNKIFDPQFLEHATDEQKLSLQAHIDETKAAIDAKKMEMQQRSMPAPGMNPANLSGGVPQDLPMQ